MNYKKLILIISLALIGWSNVSNAQTVIDIDGNVYSTVIIGMQVWMKENLKVTRYRNGDVIGTTTPATLDISGEATPKYQWTYNGADTNLAIYGRLYTWFTVTDSRSVCPSGYHVPSDAEWTTLIDYLGGVNIAGGKMKETGILHWGSPNTGADNSSGFTAFPGGYRDNFETFYAIGSSGNWWSATGGSSAAWYRNLSFGSTSVNRSSNSRSFGFSIRCLSDGGTTDINANINNSQFRLYPNPSYGRFNILIANMTTDKIRYEIYNLMGEQVLQQETSNEIDLSKSSKGIYFVKIYDGENIYIKKLVIQ